MTYSIADSVTIYHESTHTGPEKKDVSCYGYTTIVSGRITESVHWDMLSISGCECGQSKTSLWCVDCNPGPPYYLGSSHDSASEDQC